MDSCFRILTNASKKKRARNDKDCTPKPVSKCGSLKCTSPSSLLLKVGKSNPRLGKWISNDSYGTCRCEPDRHNSSQLTPTFWLMKRETATIVTKHRHHKCSRKHVTEEASDHRHDDTGNVVSNTKTGLNSQSMQCSSGSSPRSKESNKEESISRQSTQRRSFSRSNSTASDDSLDSVFVSQNDFSQFPDHTSGWSNMNTDIYITPVQRTKSRCCPPTSVYVARGKDNEIKILNKTEGLNHTLTPSFSNVMDSPTITLSFDSPPCPRLRETPPVCPGLQEDVDLNQLDPVDLGKRNPCLNSPPTVNALSTDNAPPLHVHREEDARALSREFQDCPRHRVSDIPSLPPRDKHFPLKITPTRPCITPYYVNFRGTLQSGNRLA
ncbi:uncharacterized protein [Haliotis asinina]|uniref:uncharacterized protein n=1 Tax=Haliotis asinina TaxID=109174 RepID=UPI003531C742